MSNLDVHFSSGKDDWETPQWLYDELNKEFMFAMDAASSETNSKAPVRAIDGLSACWEPFKTVWCNPPYSRPLQKEFIKKAYYERANGVTTVMLLPARTDTKAFYKYIYNKEGVEIRFLEGRLKFEVNGVPSKDAAPFPSMIVIFRGVANE